jgi:hypothetical protein
VLRERYAQSYAFLHAPIIYLDALKEIKVLAVFYGIIKKINNKLALKNE